MGDLAARLAAVALGSETLARPRPASRYGSESSQEALAVETIEVPTLEPTTPAPRSKTVTRQPHTGVESSVEPPTDQRARRPSLDPIAEAPAGSEVGKPLQFTEQSPQASDRPPSAQGQASQSMAPTSPPVDRSPPSQSLPTTSNPATIGIREPAPGLDSAADTSLPDLSILDQLWEWMEQPSPPVDAQDGPAPTPGTAEADRTESQAGVEREAAGSEAGLLEEAESATPPVADRVEVEAEQHAAAPEPVVMLETPTMVVRIGKIEIGAPHPPRPERQNRAVRPLEWAGPSLAEHLDGAS